MNGSCQSSSIKCTVHCDIFLSILTKNSLNATGIRCPRDRDLLNLVIKFAVNRDPLAVIQNLYSWLCFLDVEYLGLCQCTVSQGLRE